MEELNTLWLGISIAGIVFVAGGAWFANKATVRALDEKLNGAVDGFEGKLNTAVDGFGKSVDMLVAEMRTDREDIREWLKSHQRLLGEHGTKIAILEDREGRGAA